MRLTLEQRERIVRTVRDQIGRDAAVWLYGSRTRADSRGGDVDLLIRTSRTLDATEQARLHGRLEQELALPVDVSFIDPSRGMNRFQRLVAAEAVPVEAVP
jgi:predicted nucleotidyltransferase